MEHEQSRVITSAKNPLIKHVRQLERQAKYRRLQRQTLLDGVHVCESYLDAGYQPRQVVVGETALDHPEVAQLLVRSDGAGARTTIVSDSLMKSMSTVEHGIGIIFVIDIPEATSTPKLATDALILDGVQDPGNVGTLLRTAAAAGVRRVYLSSHSVSVWAPKVLRAGMGAQFSLELFESCDLHDLLETATVPVHATSLEAQKTIYEMDLSAPVAWLFGSEGRGVSAQLLEQATDTVIIPQASSVESLNVSAAVAVCLFEQRRQRLL